MVPAATPFQPAASDVARTLARRGMTRSARLALAMWLGLLTSGSLVMAQASPSEHESHHPGAAAAPSASSSVPADAKPDAAMQPASATGTTAAPASPSMPGGMQDMMEGMKKMMGGMGGGAASAPAAGQASAATGEKPPAGMMGMMGGAKGGAEGCCGAGAGKALYPFLMSLPALTPERRLEVERLAQERIREGTGLVQTAHERLSSALQTGDHDAAQLALQQSRDGIGRVNSGLAAHKLLIEGTSPQSVAAQWFKGEMNLAQPAGHQEARTFLGFPLFHLFTMALLIAFALAMIGMYFFKMRRTAALFGRIEPDAQAPPSGASPLPAGPPNPPSSPPPAGGPQPSGEAPPLQGTPSPPGPAAGAAAAPPPPQKWRGKLRVVDIVTETPSVKTIRLGPPSGDSSIPFTFVPGQFLNVAFAIGGARMNRSYSISSSPTRRDHVDVTVRREPRGAVSRHIDDLLKVGDSIEMEGPVGKFTFSGAEADSVVLIAGGVGVTPMMSIARYLTERSWAGEIFFVYGCRAPADFIFANEIAALQRINPKLHVAVIMSNPEGTDWKGPRGRITKEWLAQTIPDLASRRIHLCGPPAMMEATKALLAELGVPPEQVKTELFGATKPASAAAGTTVKSTAPATGPLVMFSKHDKSAKIHVDQTILELSEELAIGIEFSCRVGTCGVCKVKMTSGEVDMAVEDALEPDDKLKGMILACQAKPKVDVAVEA